MNDDNLVLNYLQSQRSLDWDDAKIESASKEDVPYKELLLYTACKLYNTLEAETVIVEDEEYQSALISYTNKIIQSAIDFLSSEEYFFPIYLEKYTEDFTGDKAKSGRRNIINIAEAKSVIKQIKFLQAEVKSKGLTRQSLKISSTDNGRRLKDRLSITDVKKLFTLFLEEELAIDSKTRKKNIIKKIIKLSIP